MGGFEPNKHMDVIRGSADTLCGSAQSVDGASQVFVEARFPICIDRGFPVFGREDQVIVEAEVGGHGSAGSEVAAISSRWNSLSMLTGGVASLNPRLMAEKPSAL